MHPMLNIAISAARSASKIAMRYLDQIDLVDVDKKDRNDLVTQIDRASEEAIIEQIRKAYPNHSILAEEGGYSEGDEYCWIIDPLDGTVNYVHGFPQFGISIGLKHNDRMEVGCIYDPVRQELYTAVRGEGAQLNSRKIRVSDCKKLEDSLIGTGFPFRDSHHLAPYLKTFKNIFPQTQGVRRAGAAVLDLAFVAAGRLDGFWESALKPWDLAAGVLLIKEAGGIVSDFYGGEDFLDNGTVVAGNPKIFKALLTEVNKALAEEA